MNFVLNAWPPNMTFAPSTNLVPVTVVEKLPTGTAVGGTAVAVGTGFSSVMLRLPESDGLDEEVASMLTELGVGEDCRCGVNASCADPAYSCIASCGSIHGPGHGLVHGEDLGVELLRVSSARTRRGWSYGYARG